MGLLVVVDDLWTRQIYFSCCFSFSKVRLKHHHNMKGMKEGTILVMMMILPTSLSRKVIGNLLFRFLVDSKI